MDMDVDIRPLGLGDEQAVHAAGSLFDKAPDPDATRRFLAEPTHHLLFAFDADGRALGYVSGIETTHPDKGTEMFLYELAVDEPVRRRGVGRALVDALVALARDRRCYGMWVLADDDNEAALATYRSAGGKVASRPVMLEWDTRGAGPR
ncbi:MAG TPA: GNAT family N-acetyltransferase [Thermoleophilaceae bacterium]